MAILRRNKKKTSIFTTRKSLKRTSLINISNNEEDNKINEGDINNVDFIINNEGTINNVDFIINNEGTINNVDLINNGEDNKINKDIINNGEDNKINKDIINNEEEKNIKNEENDSIVKNIKEKKELKEKELTKNKIQLKNKFNSKNDINKLDRNTDIDKLDRNTDIDILDRNNDIKKSNSTTTLSKSKKNIPKTKKTKIKKVNPNIKKLKVDTTILNKNQLVNTNETETTISNKTENTTLTNKTENISNIKTLMDFHLSCKKELNDLIKSFNILFYGYGNKKNILKKIFPNSLIFNMNFYTIDDVLEEINNLIINENDLNNLKVNKSKEKYILKRNFINKNNLKCCKTFTKDKIYNWNIVNLKNNDNEIINFENIDNGNINFENININNIANDNMNIENSKNTIKDNNKKLKNININNIANDNMNIENSKNTINDNNKKNTINKPFTTLKDVKINKILIFIDIDPPNIKHIPSTNVIITLERLNLKLPTIKNFIMRDLTTYEDYDIDDIYKPQNNYLSIVENVSKNSRIVLYTLLKLNKDSVLIQELFDLVKKKLFIFNKAPLFELINEFVDHKILRIVDQQVVQILICKSDVNLIINNIKMD